MAHIDIGRRNHDAVMANGKKVVLKMKDVRMPLAHITSKYEDALKDLEILHKAAHVIVNR
jgi:hypothetical protein